MKLLLVIPSLGSGGAERQLVSLAVLFQQKGLDVEFVIYHQDYFYKHILDESSIKINYINSKSSLDRIIKVRSFISRSNCDVVISFLETPSFLSCFAAVGGKKWKLITTELSSKNSTFTSTRGKFFGWFRRYSDYIVCNSYNAKNMWKIFYPSYSSRLSVIYNPVVLPEITSNYIFKNNGKLSLVVAASYQYLKNPIGLIKALILMNEVLKNKIIINWYGRIEITNGNSYAYNDSIELIKLHNLEKVIFLNGPTTDIANRMKEADIVGLFSELEGMPNAICEGMMIGKPIIMTRVSDYNRLVDETNGFLCDWDDPESIKDALESAIKLNEESMVRLGNSSKAKAENLFSSDIILNQWINLII